MSARTALKDPCETAIAMLTPALADPVPRVLFGTAAIPGFFKGQTAAVKAAAEYCLAQRWLEETGGKVGAGAKAKSLYRLTPQGVNALLRNSPPLLALQSVEETLTNQRQLLQQVHATLQRLCDPSQQQRLEQVVRSAVERLSPPDLQGFLELRREQTQVPVDASREWQDEVVRRARQATTANPLSLAELFRDLKRKWPQLELGRFHDGIRDLRDTGRIRLLPYTRAYAEIAGHREAMFFDGEVMYYVRGD
jgi:DNA-binding PadR family transcriptional regulator